MPKQIKMLSISFMGVEILLWRWSTRSELVFSFGLNLLIDTLSNLLLMGLIAPKLQGWQKALSFDYKNVRCLEEADLHYATI
jgi:hypothetical protein